MALPRRLITLGTLALLAGCSNSHYRLVATEDLSNLHACASSADNQHQLLLQQQLELKQGMTELLTELEQSRHQVAELRQSPQECVSVPSLPQEPVTVITPADEVSKQLVGANERVFFEELGIALEARIDTGISQSVIQVSSIQPFERNGEEWVRFALDADNTFEKKLLRHSSLPGQRENKRPVVQLHFTLGNLTQAVEFIVTDTPLVGKPVRIGRMALRDVMLVDVSRDNIASNAEATP